MKNSKITRLLPIALLIVVTSISFHVYPQQYSLNTIGSDLKVYGTSNLHDWHIDAEEQSGSITLNDTDDLIEKLKITIVAESLKSGKKGMDKNTYKALHTEKNASIIFQFTEVKTISKTDDQTFKVEVIGNMTIAGVTKKIALPFTVNKSTNEVRLTGEKKIKMTDFNIEPPTALLGTITTGDEVTIKFNTLFKK